MYTAANPEGMFGEKIGNDDFQTFELSQLFSLLCKIQHRISISARQKVAQKLRKSCAKVAQNGVSPKKLRKSCAKVAQNGFSPKKLRKSCAKVAQKLRKSRPPFFEYCVLNRKISLFVYS